MDRSEPFHLAQHHGHTCVEVVRVAWSRAADFKAQNGSDHLAFPLNVRGALLTATLQSSV